MIGIWGWILDIILDFFEELIYGHLFWEINMGNLFEEMNVGNFFLNTWISDFFFQVCLIDVRFQSKLFLKHDIIHFESAFLAKNDICLMKKYIFWWTMTKIDNFLRPDPKTDNFKTDNFLWPAGISGGGRSEHAHWYGQDVKRGWIGAFYRDLFD